MARISIHTTLVIFTILILSIVACQLETIPTPGPGGPTSTPAGLPSVPAGGVTPNVRAYSVNWTEGQKFSASQLTVTVKKIGPPTWQYFIEASPPQCYGTPCGKITSVEILSSAIPNPCQQPNHEPVSAPNSPNWMIDHNIGKGGYLINGPQDGEVNMTFKIDCDATNGPIYFYVKAIFGGATPGGATIGPLPGPIYP